MKPGDLVRAKFITLAHKKAIFSDQDFSVPVLVMEKYKGAIKVLLPSGKIKTDMADNYVIVSECE